MGALVETRTVTGADDQRGAAAVEYALLIALIAAVLVVAAELLGLSVSSAFTLVTTRITNALAVAGA